MAIFNDKIVSGQFINSEKTLIEILYKEGDEIIPYVLEVDFTQEDFQDLLKELTLDEIETQTQNNMIVEKNFFEKVINEEITRRISTNSTKKVAFDDISAKDFFELLNSKNEDNDFIFNTKILILDNSKDNMSKDKEFKMKIRKSKTLMELLDTYTSANMKIK